MLDPIAMSGSFKFNAYSELNFTIGRTYTDMITGETQVNPFYNKIEALRLVELDGFGFFEIQEPEIVSNGIREVKNITAYSLEYTLSQKYLEEFYINTGENNSVEVMYAQDNNRLTIEPVLFYNIGNPKLSLLNLVIEKAYGWSIGHVDKSLQDMSRTFEVSRASIYDFIVQDICEKFNCFAVFDTVTKKIHFYSEALITKHLGDGETKTFKVPSAYSTLGSVSVDGYRTTQYEYKIETKNDDSKIGYVIFDDGAIPAKGSKIEITDGSQEQWQTDVYVTFQNLAQEVNVSYSADDIKTVLTVKGADDLDIREVNMGLPYLVDISYYYNVDWMGQELFDTYTEYVENTNKYQDAYTDNAQRILELNNKLSFLENRVSLGYGIDHSVNSQTVGTYYVIDGGSYPDYTYKEVSLPSEYNANTTYYKLNGVNVTEEKVHTLYSAVRKYFMDIHQETAPEIKDIATREETWQELLEDLTEQFEFVESAFAELKAALTPEASITTSSNAYRKFLDLIFGELGRTPLRDLFLKPYEEIKKANDEYKEEDSGHYWFYYPVNIIIDSLNAAIDNLTAEIEPIERELNEKTDENSVITEKMSIYNHFTPSQLIRLSSFLREDEYTDDNFVETSVDTIDTLMKTKNELRECGKIELSKLCEPKLSFSMDMANIYALPEFESIIDQFQLGKLINVAIRDDYVKRARLLAVDINFDDFSDFTCEFGELTNLKTQSSIHADLLASALSAGKMVASNMSYWNQGADKATSTDLKIQEGLLYGTNGLFTSDQGVIIDKQGIKLTKVDPSTGETSPYQAWLKNNTIMLSSDGFKTSRMGLGEFNIGNQTFYGILSEAMLSGYIEGSDIVGGTINIGNGKFEVDSAGNVTMNAASIAGYVTNDELNDVAGDLSSRIDVTENGIATKVSKDSIISTINQSAESVVIDASKISLAGKTINLTSDNIAIKSTNFNVTKDGKITATSGEIAGWTIYPGLFRKETTIDNVDYQIYMQSTDGVKTTNAFAVRKKDSNTSDWDVQFSVNYAGKLMAKNAEITGAITATSLSLGSGVTIPYSKLSGTPNLDIYIAKDGTVGAIPASGSTGFKVSSKGLLQASNAVIYGTIYASAGTIAGYNIGSGGSYGNALYKRVSGDSIDYEVGLKATSGDTDLAFYVKESTDDWNSSSNTFYVRNNGQLYAQNADITGKITASSGKISGNLDISGALTNTHGDYTVTLRGVQSDVGKGVFYITDNSSGSAEYPVRINGDGSARFTNVTITGSSTIAYACIPNLNADKITAGTLDVGRIPNISASKITSGTISTDRLDASVITTGNFSSKTLSTSNLTVASGCRLGVASEYNALIRTVGDYTYIRGYGPDVNYETSFYNLVKYVVQNSSSQEIKNEIHDFDDRYDVFFDKLNPKLFRYNFEPNMGYTMGYIWQEAEQARIDANLDRNDIGAITETDSVVGGLALSKQDFIALNTWQIQKLKSRVEELENKLEALEGNDTK